MLSNVSIMRNVLDKISVIKFESHISIFFSFETTTNGTLGEISQRIMFKHTLVFRVLVIHLKFISYFYIFEDSDLERVKARKYFWISCWQNFNFITKPVEILSRRVELLEDSPSSVKDRNY